MLTKRKNIQQLLQIHAEKGVPMEMSVPLLLKLAGRGVEETATEAGFTRTHFYLALRGERTPPRKLRQLLARRLGRDPWTVYRMAGAHPNERSRGNASGNKPMKA